MRGEEVKDMVDLALAFMMRNQYALAVRALVDLSEKLRTEINPGAVLVDICGDMAMELPPGHNRGPMCFRTAPSAKGDAQKEKE